MTKTFITAFISTSLIFLIVDSIWLSFTVKLLYRPALGSLIIEKPVMWAAILFYIVYSIGLAFIILGPALVNNSVFQALWMGALFGFVAYGTYNLTNMAVITNWSPKIVLIDMLWGGFLTGFSCMLGIFISKSIFSS